MLVSYQFIKHDPKGEQIHVGTPTRLPAIRSPVARSARSSLSGSELACDIEIDEFCRVRGKLEQNVCRLDISMENFFLMKVTDSIQKIADDKRSAFLGKGLTIFNDIVELTYLT